MHPGYATAREEAITARSRQHGSAALILKSEIYNFHRLDLIRRAGFVVTIYDEDGLRLAATAPLAVSRHRHERLRLGLQEHFFNAVTMGGNRRGNGRQQFVQSAPVIVELDRRTQ
jgi:hypothetical protein